MEVYAVAKNGPAGPSFKTIVLLFLGAMIFSGTVAIAARTVLGLLISLALAVVLGYYGGNLPSPKRHYFTRKELRAEAIVYGVAMLVTLVLGFEIAVVVAIFGAFVTGMTNALSDAVVLSTHSM